MSFLPARDPPVAESREPPVAHATAVAGVAASGRPEKASAAASTCGGTSPAGNSESAAFSASWEAPAPMAATGAGTRSSGPAAVGCAGAGRPRWWTSRSPDDHLFSSDAAAIFTISFVKYQYRRRGRRRGVRRPVRRGTEAAPGRHRGRRHRSRRSGRPGHRPSEGDAWETAGAGEQERPQGDLGRALLPRTAREAIPGRPRGRGDVAPYRRFSCEAPGCGVRWRASAGRGIRRIAPGAGRPVRRRRRPEGAGRPARTAARPSLRH